jgi:hypothetical protein
VFGLLALRDLHCALAVCRHWSAVASDASAALTPEQRGRTRKRRHPQRCLHVHVSSMPQLLRLCLQPSRLSVLLSSLHIGDSAPVDHTLLARAAAAMPNLTHLLVWLAPHGRLPPAACFQLRQLRWLRVVFAERADPRAVNDSLATLAQLRSLLSVLLVAQGAFDERVCLAPLQQLPQLVALDVWQSSGALLTDAQSAHIASIPSLRKPAFPCSLRALRSIVADAASRAQPLPWTVWRLHARVDELLLAQLPAALPLLAEVHLCCYRCCCTAATFAALAALQRLVTLKVHGACAAHAHARTVADGGAAAVAQSHGPAEQLPPLPRVRTLLLEGVGVRAHAVALLAALPSLTELHTSRSMSTVQSELRRALGLRDAVTWRKQGA